MKTISTRDRLLASTIICGALLAASPVFAQTAPGTQPTEDLTASGGAPVESLRGQEGVTSDAQGNSANEVETIVVTGSRIPQPNLTSNSPVTVVGQQDVQLRGVTRVEDLVNQLPQVFAAQNSSVANGATGTATINLRGVGTDRNLILVNGRRLPFGSPLDTAADVNQVPSALVERVEVLTGGAASIYGSDAISGVVNFIMQRDFEGVRLEAQYSTFQHNNDYDTNGNLREVLEGRSQGNPNEFRVPKDNVWDGAGTTFNVTMGVGTEDGRGNITVFGSYRDNDEILQADRDYSACTIGVASATGFTCGGSGTNATGRFTTLSSVTGFQTTATGTPILDANGARIPLSIGVGGDLTSAGTSAFRPYTTNDQYNFGPLNFYQRPDERYSFGAFGRYQFNDKVEAYTELLFSDYQTNAQIAPGGVFYGGQIYSLSCSNPFIAGAQATALGCGAAPAGPVQVGTDDAGAPVFATADPGQVVDTVDVLIGRRNVEGGGRQDNLGYESYRIVTGLRGEIAEGFTYDVVGQFSEVTLARSSANDFYSDRIALALDAVTDASGNIVCRNPDPTVGVTCVPYNPFDLGGATAESLGYVQGIAVQTGTTQQQVVTAAFTADLGRFGMQSPLSENSIKAAFGVEYRRDELEAVSDRTFETGNLSGQGGPTPSVRGATEVYDLFGEIQVPLAENLPGVDLLDVNASYRFSDYDSGFTTNTYGVNGNYSPFDGLRFRASYARAVRAPNVIDLFTPQGLNLFDLDSDPCGEDRLATQAQCVATGVPAANYGNATLLDSPAGQYNFLEGGNPDLDPETGDTYTLGLVYTPSFIEGLNVTLDYFSIEVKDLISLVDPTIIVDGCYGVRGQAQNQSLCGFINRNSLGNFWTNGGFIEALNTNIGGLQTSGFDLAANYTFDLEDFGMPDYGGFSLSYIGTKLEELITDPGVSDEYDCVGQYGNACGVPNPEYRHNARITYQSPVDLDLSLTWRHYGEVELFGNTADRVDAKLDAQDYFDLAGVYRFNDMATFRAGVNNVFDEDPPLSASVGTTGNGNTFPQTYDAFGRYFFAGVTLDF